MTLLVDVLKSALFGGWAYCALSLVAVRLYVARNRSRIDPKRAPVGLSVLKPLSGAEEDLEANLRTFFEQDYRRFEIVFGVRREDDAAVAVVRRLQEEYPDVPARLLILGDSIFANAKVFSLSRMTEVATHTWLVMSDSDISVAPHFLSRLSDEIASGQYDLATCPYRSIPASGLWSRLEALGLNTEFWSGVLVAKMIEGMTFAVGPTVVARQEIFKAVRWEYLGDYHADDFVMGRRASSLGFRVGLSHCVVEHHIGGPGMRENFEHRLRWARSTRRSRPWGYIGQVFTNPVPISLLLCAFDLRFWPLAIITLFLRGVMASSVSESVLKDPLVRQRWYLLPLQDILSLGFWLAGFSGTKITWRGRDYRINRDGTIELLA